MIFDTCALIDLEQGDAGIVKLAKNERVLHLPMIVIGEFRCGLSNPNAPVQLARAFIDNLVPLCTPLGLTHETTRHYADIWYELRVNGTPIPMNDIWIAALAREHRLPVATRDAHFKRIKGLKVVGW